MQEKTKKLKGLRLILLLSLLAGTVYNSWPMGYVFNPRVTRLGLASDLGAVNQPYSWVFDYLDVLVSVCIVGMISLIYHPKLARPVSVIWHVIAVGLFIFALFTILSAVIPLNCAHSIAQCGVARNQLFSFHDIAGAIGSFGQFLSLAGVVALARTHHLPKKSVWLAWIILIFWSGTGLVYLGFVTSTAARNIQEYFLVLTGVGLIITGYIIGVCRLKLPKT